MNSAGFVWDLGVNMEVNGIIVIGTRRKVLPMHEIIKPRVEHLLSDIFMYHPAGKLC